MDRIRFIDHEGQKILLADFSGCGAQEVAALADSVPLFVTPEPDRSVLLLADFSNAKLNRENVERIKIAAVRNRQHLRRSAWVFNGNLPKVLHHAVQTFSSREIPKFESREAAMEFLVGGSQHRTSRAG